MLRIATIGVYGFNAVTFLARLQEANVTLVVDVRQRRGVRGPEYVWANSRRLQATLAEAEIGYQHRRDLAPTTELRELQWAEDRRQGVGIRGRRTLAGDFDRRYTTEILDQAGLTGLVSALPATGLAVLLCVEREPEACHRSLVARRLAERCGVAVEHLGPR